MNFVGVEPEVILGFFWVAVSSSERLIKVAARVRETSRRVVVELSASWPYLDHFRQVVQRLFANSLAAPNIG